MTHEPAMMVRCPQCSTGYVLPDHLIGPGGARVRCPECTTAFVVPAAFSRPALAASSTRAAAGGSGSTVATEAATAEAVPPAATPSSAAPRPALAAADIATELLDDLATRLGPALSAARARGTVLSDHGPAILDAYAEYRQRAGAGVPATPFRAALRDRWGVDLTGAVQT